MQASVRLRSPTLLTLDAFGTLFSPKEPIAKQYGDVARSLGLQGFSDEEVGAAFRKGIFSAESKPECRARHAELAGS